MLTRKIAEKKVVLNGEKQFDPKEFVSNFENFINGDIDVIDFQNYLLDVGLDKCASF
jgi:hypothetical protein